MIKKRLPCRKGFTLIELLIVTAMIGILAGIATPNFLTARTKAKVARAFIEIRNIADGLELVYIDTQAYPDNPSAVQADLRDYLASIPDDPFNSSGSRGTGSDNCDAIAPNSYGYAVSADLCWLLFSNGPDDTADILSGDSVNFAPAYRMTGNIGGGNPILLSNGNHPYNVVDKWNESNSGGTGDIGRGGP